MYFYIWSILLFFQIVMDVLDASEPFYHWAFKVWFDEVLRSQGKVFVACAFPGGPSSTIGDPKMGFDFAQKELNGVRRESLDWMPKACDLKKLMCKIST